MAIVEDKIIETSQKPTDQKSKKQNSAEEIKRETRSEDRNNKSKNKDLKNSKAFSELPKIGARSPKDVSFFSEKMEKSNKQIENKSDRFSKLPAISEGFSSFSLEIEFL